MMKIVLAPDKYKGSITALEFCDIVASVIQKTKTIEVLKCPLADGGDGTIAVVNYYLKGNTIKVKANNPLFQPIIAHYIYSETTKTAFIEMAEASGMKLLKADEQNCMYTSTYGTGELIIDAINKGAKHIILGIGGSATNDCGIGMAYALGYRFLDVNNKEVKPIGKSLPSIANIDDTLVDNRLKAVKFQVACDVNNPLYGKNGAAHVYAKQKGATNSDILYLDEGLKHFASILDVHFQKDVQRIKGAGAAGGMGAGTVTFLNAELLPGIELVKQIAEFDEVIKDADWIITGEGQLDAQTLSGKAISGILKSAKAQQIPVAALCGSVTLNEEELKQMGIHYTASIIQKASNLEDAIENTTRYLKEIVKEFKLIFLI